jgi:hypothetical protein
MTSAQGVTRKKGRYCMIIKKSNLQDANISTMNTHNDRASKYVRQKWCNVTIAQE